MVTTRRLLIIWKVPYGRVPPTSGPDIEAGPLCGAPTLPLSTSVMQAVGVMRRKGNIHWPIAAVALRYGGAGRQCNGHN